MDIDEIVLVKKRFATFIEDGLVTKSEFRTVAFDRFVSNSIESLESAKQLLTTNTSNLWVIVCSYYAMFYIDQAYIYTRGYKGTSQIIHQVVNDALIVLAQEDLTKQIMFEYGQEREQATQIMGQTLDSYGSERSKRSIFQYETTEAVKRAKAQTSLDRAIHFVDIMRKILARK